MNKRIRRYHIIGAIFTLIVGTLLHFVHEWFGGHITAIFGAINESTWEHLKLLFWPVVFFSIVEYLLYGKEKENFISSRIFSLIVGLMSIVVIFYTYTGILGYPILAVDISLFVISVFITYFLSYKLITNYCFTSKRTMALFLSMLLIFVMMFTVFSYFPPDIALFS